MVAAEDVMSDPSRSLQAGALLEDVKLELDSVHRAALAADAGALRRGLDLSITNLEKALEAGLEDGTETAVAAILSSLETARSDLEGGALVEMAQLIETARASLALL